jgi:hypothetical protein
VIGEGSLHRRHGISRRFLRSPRRSGDLRRA